MQAILFYLVGLIVELACTSHALFSTKTYWSHQFLVAIFKTPKPLTDE